MTMLRAWTLIGLLCCAATLSPGAGRAAPAVDYSAASNWLCRPGGADACGTPLTSTVVPPGGGALSKRTYAPDPAAPIDCFYIYPTVSQEQAANADMVSGPEEQHAAAEQFARFAAKCRTFAPLYRQTTVAAMRGRIQDADRDLAYADVLAAWRSYLAHDNHGRGVVLVGHSQGASLLARLIAEEIDGKPVQRQLVSAIIPGTGVQVPVGKDVGGGFHHVPLCRRADQTGCVIAYSTFLASDPPGPDAYFGKSDGPGLAYACVNPGALVDDGVLDSELPTVGETAKMLGTPLVENPGLISAACTTAGDRTFLAVSIKPTGVGAATLSRVLTAMSARAPAWGLHVIDVNLTLGDLVEIVGRQGQAWAAQNR
ncbi:MAG TPA: DUF3089 domain-containing protein [Caulobacteraceae bacterium]